MMYQIRIRLLTSIRWVRISLVGMMRLLVKGSISMLFCISNDVAEWIRIGWSADAYRAHFIKHIQMFKL